jgi:hypothetical protein
MAQMRPLSSPPNRPVSATELGELKSYNTDSVFPAGFVDLTMCGLRSSEAASLFELADGPLLCALIAICAPDFRRTLRARLETRPNQVFRAPSDQRPALAPPRRPRFRPPLTVTSARCCVCRRFGCGIRRSRHANDPGRIRLTVPPCLPARPQRPPPPRDR